ncbi:hypothetical protein CHLRE_06g284050v5 [Chlamydomonas reinhardtii]|uniref:YEATS domain-containing protein n=1 Tax=Chlamydomonas reinhardtii TaxID=3055 RepID=A8J266_CHLRE|nr:uncharacterized protein CHLRE_06g284050v5 [Chlamydomonas reinhardtii]PNW82563.1 hypothetical protein CHLRE_06g284050v5 [Chlamydomonas reinhardtii]|eukprot:XP_001695345.1 transcription factor IIF [Chlamydomonas reinhardtii]
MDDGTFIDEQGSRRLRDTELVVPVVVGTCAWWLGKKANDSVTHRWTVYFRSANGEDLSHIISKVTFELHHTFTNPHRVCLQAPYEVTEQGWGEFDINITLTFTPDAREKDVSIMHRLKLYESESTPNTTKKPVMSEVYEELVFSEPVESFYRRVVAEPQRRATELSCQAWILTFDEREEVEKLKECRARVAAMVAEVRKDFEGAAR